MCHPIFHSCPLTVFISFKIVCKSFLNLQLARAQVHLRGFDVSSLLAARDLIRMKLLKTCSPLQSQNIQISHSKQCTYIFFLFISLQHCTLRNPSLSLQGQVLTWSHHFSLLKYINFKTLLSPVVIFSFLVKIVLPPMHSTSTSLEPCKDKYEIW